MASNIVAFGGQDYVKLKRDLLKGHVRGSLFKDLDFPAADQSIQVKKLDKHFDNIRWSRPKDIVRDPQFFVKGATRFDFDQGELGNCWFIAAAANFADFSQKDKKLFDMCVPGDQRFDRDYAGIFRFRFWRFGRWTEVVVDDRLLVGTPRSRLWDDSELPIFGHNREQPNEFWAALFEKAYAKLHGCYHNLDGGFVNDALVDFTGGISEMYVKDDLPGFFETLWGTLHMDSMAGCCIESEQVEKSTGLIGLHAYSINKVAQVNYKGRTVNLVRLRNPWGHTEWKGPWSYKSKEWRFASVSNAEMGSKDNGEFWMAYDDFLKHFDRITLTHLVPDAMAADVIINVVPDAMAAEEKCQWHTATYHSSWVRDVSAGGSVPPAYWINPRFKITVTEENDDDNDGNCTLIVSLLQKDEDLSRNLRMSFDIYELCSDGLKRLNGPNYRGRQTTLKEKIRGVFKPREKHTMLREMTRRFLVPPATYIIIPSTKKPHMESEFYLRIFTEKESTSSEEMGGN